MNAVLPIYTNIFSTHQAGTYPYLWLETLEPKTHWLCGRPSVLKRVSSAAEYTHRRISFFQRCIVFSTKQKQLLNNLHTRHEHFSAAAANLDSRPRRTAKCCSEVMYTVTTTQDSQFSLLASSETCHNSTARILQSRAQVAKCILQFCFHISKPGRRTSLLQHYVYSNHKEGQPALIVGIITNLP